MKIMHENRGLNVQKFPIFLSHSIILGKEFDKLIMNQSYDYIITLFLENKIITLSKRFFINAKSFHSEAYQIMKFPKSRRNRLFW